MDEALAENLQRVSRSLDVQCQEIKLHFEDERDDRRQQLDDMYEELLTKFLADTQVPLLHNVFVPCTLT